MERRIIISGNVEFRNNAKPSHSTTALIEWKKLFTRTLFVPQGSFMMGKSACLSLLCLVILLCTGNAFARDTATASEVMDKVKEAAAVLSKTGRDGLQQFQDEKSQWVWKDTYVFVFDCDNLTMLANPVYPDLVGKRQAGLVDKTGNYFFIGFCDAIENSPNGRWVEYWWPEKKGQAPKRKLSFVMQVPDRDFGVGGGIYTDAETAMDLNTDLQ